ELAVPASLRAAVTTRARRVGRDVEELLRAAAVVGEVFDLEAVAELLGIPLEETVRRAERALQAHLLVEDLNRYRFVNALVREVLYETSPAPSRLVRHRRLAELFADRPESAAAHAAAAGDWETAARNWLTAARQAAARLANRDAEAVA
ncbi:MAG: transcriptional regulator, partial [Actinomycetota bacterium]|nr:transcriptional regulator [Actinomycetota bacterium]